MYLLRICYKKFGPLKKIQMNRILCIVIDYPGLSTSWLGSFCTAFALCHLDMFLRCTEDKMVYPAPVGTVLVDIHDRQWTQSFHFEMFQGCRSYSLYDQLQVGIALLDMQSNQTLDALYCSTFQLDIFCTLQ